MVQLLENALGQLQFNHIKELLEATVGNLRKRLLSAFHCTSPLDKSVHSVI